MIEKYKVLKAFPYEFMRDTHYCIPADILIKVSAYGKGEGMTQVFVTELSPRHTVKILGQYLENLLPIVEELVM